MSSPIRPPEPIRLSDRERALLTLIAAHEQAADAAFANRLAAGRPGRAERERTGRVAGSPADRTARRRLVGLVGLLGALGVVSLVATAGPVAAVIAAVVLVVVPVALVGWALRQGDPAPE